MQSLQTQIPRKCLHSEIYLKNFTNHDPRLEEGPPGLGVPPLFALDDLEDEGVLGQDPEDVDDAGHDPRLDGREALGLGRVGRDGVEDVDQDEEERDQQGHPSWRNANKLIEKCMQASKHHPHPPKCLQELKRGTKVRD